MIQEAYRLDLDKHADIRKATADFEEQKATNT
jgi:hypothetical protein